MKGRGMHDAARQAMLLPFTQRRRTMKCVCLGYYDRGKHEAMTEAEQHAMFDDAVNTTTIFAPMGMLLGSSASTSGNRPDFVLEERQSRNDGWSLCRN